jgi:hypothetical protein
MKYSEDMKRKERTNGKRSRKGKKKQKRNGE